MDKLDQDARIALLNEYSSNKRAWAINALTLVIATFAAIQHWQFIEKLFGSLFLFGLLGFLLGQISYAFIWYLYYAQTCKSVLEVPVGAYPVRPYIDLLNQKVIEKTNCIRWNRLPLWRSLHAFHRFPLWLLWAAVWIIAGIIIQVRWLAMTILIISIALIILLIAPCWDNN